MGGKRDLDISCVDLFCGAGGLTHGMVRGGLKVTAGIDLDPVCRHPYEANNPGAIFIERDISQLMASEVKALFAPGSISVLAGCAPCQPFSTYAQRYDSKRDGKWALLNEFQRLIKEVKPDIVTMENVPTVRRYRVFKDFVSTLKKKRYHVWFDVVDCADYGVPQTRKRTVLFASKHGPISLIDKTREHPKTVRQAIERLKPLKAGERAAKDRLHVAASLDPRNLKRIRASKPGGTWRDWPKHLRAECHKSATGKSYPSVYGRMEWDKPAPTMTTQCFGYGNGRFGHPKQNRAISLREAAILQGFPRDYVFAPPRESVGFKAMGRLIGNAVPVDIGHAIARSIVKHVEEVGVKTMVRGRKKKPNCRSARNKNQ
jgi:DNA (cytosine-5)-methyltransferase 1